MVEYLPHVMWAWAVLPFAGLATDIYHLAAWHRGFLDVGNVAVGTVFCAAAVAGVVGLRRRRQWGRKTLLALAYVSWFLASGAHYAVLDRQYYGLGPLLLFTALAATGGILGDRRVVAACGPKRDCRQV